ncbi:MAG: type V CRISPR-associated protein Cas4 [Candidatus Yonathbacteria bacterium CG_4_10_14_3_um_filter_47_65]|uniref:CRISPR-associated exonuclease Cas4 n=1 Tax=Candidatus Yonathbacteria bacterium CG_4_9_14_0_8_um_filter_46_47 TaxID=1975106 RepID=A0A2M8D6R5_9BACT|nr:MAG: endonuclease [Candidatus Yonathbacteria bacterium CG23_combo_of_CG06-09_8_20_14_all_46_18]PIX56220.1 MAG: type V CRISPR-associated protein Cas4 [Candidatus Yonathbacteria bacterium CG_4_10_14_3_um_filter_47_65]PJB82689.1 MAG: type V CRISPR-associated protein Cas4 [Candidatus Yonathbacteria bacterium CG_4_9_14_0_8_um_filter_46_47]PJC19765.1 MAG: type V CRISPR-associated protein Cas4 [Candidatus Yonathbacteria bacterium CG_4_9_14_0_2_um_filter_47_74]PJC67749.1 MAG: type V CRISPR-associate
MEPYIQISKINDFIFCPQSVYLHTIYDNFDAATYHDEPQKEGKLNHENIDNGKYSTSAHILQGMPVYSHHYNLAGKIDLFDREKKMLIERKTSIKHIYDGYKYQLYAQYFCLKDMGYDVERLRLYSLKNNKQYDIPLPGDDETRKFEKIIQRIRRFDVLKNVSCVSEAKCARCIYSNLCHLSGATTRTDQELLNGKK